MAKELTEEEKKKVLGKSTNQILEDFYNAQAKKTGKSKQDIMQAGLDRLQSEANAKDAEFNANLAKQRELRNSQENVNPSPQSIQANTNIAPQLTQKNLNSVSEQKFQSKYLTQEQVQAQKAFDERQSNMVPIKEPEYTEAGKVGQSIRKGLGSAIGYGADLAQEFLLEPTINMPGQALNMFPAAAETIAGVAGVPLDLGRVPKINVPTRFDKPEPYPAEAPEKPQPLSEQESTQETAPKPKEALKKAYAVVFAGEKANKNATFDNAEDAKKYYADQGGTKGGIITLSPQKKETAQEQAERIAYGQTNKQAEDRNALKQKLTETGKKAWAEAKKARDAENAANRAKFEKFKEGASEKDEALAAYNKFNKSQSLLNKAYNEAIKSKNYGAANYIQKVSERESAGVPVEQGAMQEYFRKQVPIQRNLAIQRESEKRKLDADFLSKIESNMLLNKRYNESMAASNPDASFNTQNSFYGGSFSRL